MQCNECPICKPNDDLKLRLPFSEDMQDAVLGYLLSVPQFFLQSRNKIKPNWFLNTHCGKIYAIQLKFFNQFKRMPSLEEIKIDRDLLIEDQRTRNIISARIVIALSRCASYGLDKIKQDLNEWLMSVIFQGGIENSVKLFNAKKVYEGCEHITKISKDLRECRFDDGEEVKFDNPGSIPQELEVDYANSISTGLSILDLALTPEGVKSGGCLLPGDMTIVLAPSNIGKSSVLITTIAHNIKQKKRVLYMTHEGRSNDIRNKIYCSVIGCSMAQLMGLYKTPEGFKILEDVSHLLADYLTYIPYNKPGMTVEEVEPIIRRYQETLMATDERGRGYDLLVVDYPAKLTTSRSSKGLLPQRISDLIVYDYYVQLALEYKFHVLCAIQSNREGAKVNQGLKEDRFLVMEDVNEAYGPMQIATNVLSLNRDIVSSLKEFMTFYVCKSRSSRVGTAVVAKTNFAHCITHSDALGGYYYNANAPMSDKLEHFLEMYNGKAVPITELQISREV